MIENIAVGARRDIDPLPAALDGAVPMGFAAVTPRGSGPGAPLDEARVQRTVLGGGCARVAALGAGLGLALVVGAEAAAGGRVLPSAEAARLDAQVHRAVALAARDALLVARVGAAAVRGAEPTRAQRVVARVAPPRAARRGAPPVVLAESGRVALVAGALDLSRARSRFARVLLAEEGGRVELPWLVA